MSFSQNNGVVINKSIGVTGKPTDLRSWHYNGGAQRPYANRAEILTELSHTDPAVTALIRAGNTPLYSFESGVTREWWFKNGTTDNDLVERFTDGVGGSVGSASLGITKTGDTFQIGQAIDAIGDPALINSDRVIPVSPTNSLILKGTGTNTAKAALKFSDTFTPTAGQTRTRTWLEFEPLEKGMNSGSFGFHQGITKYTNGLKGNETFNFGWNFAPGGGLQVPGHPALGMSWEQWYDQNGTGVGMPEMHDFYIKADGTQVRLRSYTINTGTGFIDYYKTVSNFYIKNPANTNLIYYQLDGPTPGNMAVQQAFRITDRTFTFNYSDQGIQLLMTVPSPVYLNSPTELHLPAGVMTPTYNSFTKETTVSGALLKAEGGIFIAGEFAHSVFPNEKPFHVGYDAMFNGTMTIKDLIGVGNRPLAVNEDGKLIIGAGAGGGDVYLATANQFTKAQTITVSDAVNALVVRSSDVNARIVIDSTTEAFAKNSGLALQEGGVDKWTIGSTSDTFYYYNNGLGSFPFTIWNSDNRVNFYNNVYLDALKQAGDVMLILNSDGKISTQEIPSGGSAGIENVTVTGTSQVGAVNKKYTCYNAGLTSIALPTTALVGEEIIVVAAGGAVRLTQEGDGTTGQTVAYTTDGTTRGAAGYLELTTSKTAVTLTCTKASGEDGTEWVVQSFQGVIDAI